MSIVTIEDTNLTNIANAIRIKNGTSTKYKPNQMASAIESIEVGMIPTGTIEITENGTYDVTDYATANVDVASSGGAEEYFHLDTQPTSGNFYQTFLKSIPSIDVSQYTSLRSFFSKYESLQSVGTLNVENCTSLDSLFSGCENLTTIGNIINSNNVTNINYMLYNCYKILEAPQMDTSNVTTASYMFSYAKLLETIPEYDFSKVRSITNMFNVNIQLTNLGGFKNLGKGYTATTANNSSCEFDLAASSNQNITYESLMNVINNLYDLNLTYDVANGGTLYTQKLTLGYKCLLKLTADEIAIATNKGWAVS